MSLAYVFVPLGFKPKQQLALQEAIHQKMLDEVKGAAELRYQDEAKRNEKLERRLKEVEGDYQSMIN